MLTILAAIIAAVLGCAFGALAGLIRDQDKPGWSEAKPAFSKWKELVWATIGLPLAGIALVKYGLGIDGLVSAGVIWIGMGAAWAGGHLEGMGLRFSPGRGGVWKPMAEVYARLTASGALVTLAPAGLMAWHGAFLAAAVVLLAGAAKVGCYEAAYILRGLDAPRPHAGTLAAIAHGAILYAVTAAAMVLA